MFSKLQKDEKLLIAERAVFFQEKAVTRQNSGTIE